MSHCSDLKYAEKIKWKYFPQLKPIARLELLPFFVKEKHFISKGHRSSVKNKLYKYVFHFTLDLPLIKRTCRLHHFIIQLTFKKRFRRLITPSVRSKAASSWPYAVEKSRESQSIPYWLDSQVQKYIDSHVMAIVPQAITAL